MYCVFLVLLYVGYGVGKLWPKGVVHYAINKKDYDVHSQDEIISTLSQLKNEICVKFFYTPLNYSASATDKILYISNPDKRKNCPPTIYDFSGNVVDMPIGYKCVNQKDIARIVVDMLRDSIKQTVSTINSFDLIKKFRERTWLATLKDYNATQPSLLSPTDRNFINAHYHEECGAFSQRSVAARRQGDDISPEDNVLTEENRQYYSDKLWPLGIIMYGVDEKFHGTANHDILKYAMTSIELSSCVVFQEILANDTVLAPKNYLWFTNDGEDMPQLGFQRGKQIINLESMTHGAPGHTAHTLVNLVRALGLPMMSNRFDRDNYVTVDWGKIEKGKEHYLEKAPVAAWVRSSYDFDSATHAPANYMCFACELGGQSVRPVQDHLWQRTLTMGHKTELTESDSLLLNLLYDGECKSRVMSRDYSDPGDCDMSSNDN